MTYTYNNGFREGVVFSFVNKHKEVLIENRIMGNEIHIFFPSGSIETKDLKSGTDYRINALHREVEEEFNGAVIMKDIQYLNEVYVDEIKIVFYVYMITKWDGEFPEYVVEEGEEDAKLEWVRLNDFDEVFEFESAKEIARRIIAYLHQYLDKGGCVL